MTSEMGNKSAYRRAHGGATLPA